MKHIQHFYKSLLSCMVTVFLKKIKLKAEDLKSPWITRGIKEFGKHKQRLYEKFSKKRTEKMNLNIKIIKNFLNQ